MQYVRQIDNTNYFNDVKQTLLFILVYENLMVT